MTCKSCSKTDCQKRHKIENGYIYRNIEITRDKTRIVAVRGTTIGQKVNEGGFNFTVNGKKGWASKLRMACQHIDWDLD